MLCLDDFREIIVVDDDSPDGTWKLVQELAEKDERIRLRRRVGQRGLTSALNEGIKAAKGDILVWMDCDFSHPPEMVPELLDQVNQGYDIAVASRYVSGGGDYRNEQLHRLLSRIITGLSSLLLDGSFKDYTSGFIAVRKSVFEKVKLEGDYGEYFISLIYQALKSGFRVTEVPFKNVSRQAGESKTALSALDFAVRGRKYFYTIFKLAFGASRV